MKSKFSSLSSIMFKTFKCIHIKFVRTLMQLCIKHNDEECKRLFLNQIEQYHNMNITLRRLTVGFILFTKDYLFLCNRSTISAAEINRKVGNKIK